MKRKLIIILALLVSTALVAFAQSRMRAHGASIIFSSAGGVAITPASGQGISFAGGTNTTGNATFAGYVTSAGQLTASKDPANGTNTSASLLVNPATSAANEYLFVVADNGTTRASVDKEGDSFFTTAKVGSAGSVLTGILKLSATLSPVEVAADTAVEQTFTVAGLAVGDVVSVNKPTVQAGLGLCGARVTATDTIGICFQNVTGSPITPTASEVYRVSAIR